MTFNHFFVFVCIYPCIFIIVVNDLISHCYCDTIEVSVTSCAFLSVPQFCHRSSTTFLTNDFKEIIKNVPSLYCMYVGMSVLTDS